MSTQKEMFALDAAAGRRVQLREALDAVDAAARDVSEKEASVADAEQTLKARRAHLERARAGLAQAQQALALAAAALAAAALAGPSAEDEAEYRRQKKLSPVECGGEQAVPLSEEEFRERVHAQTRAPEGWTRHGTGWENWALARAEVEGGDGGWVARLRHGGYPQLIGTFDTLAAACGACAAECARREKEEEERQEAGKAFVQEILADDGEGTEVVPLGDEVVTLALPAEVAGAAGAEQDGDEDRDWLKRLELLLSDPAIRESYPKTAAALAPLRGEWPEDPAALARLAEDADAAALCVEGELLDGLCVYQYLRPGMIRLIRGSLLAPLARQLRAELIARAAALKTPPADAPAADDGPPGVPAVFTTGQIAKLLKVAPRTVSKWFDSGKLKGYRVPGSNDRRVPREQLVRFCEENGTPVPDFSDVPPDRPAPAAPAALDVVSRSLRAGFTGEPCARCGRRTVNPPHGVRPGACYTCDAGLAPADLPGHVRAAAEQHPGAICVFRDGTDASATCTIPHPDHQALAAKHFISPDFPMTRFAINQKTLAKAGYKVVLLDRIRNEDVPPGAVVEKIPTGAPDPMRVTEPAADGIACWLPPDWPGKPPSWMTGEGPLERFAGCLTQLRTLPRWWGRGDDLTARIEQELARSLLRGTLLDDRDRAKIGAISRHREQRREAAPAWGEWAEFDVTLEGATKVRCVYLADFGGFEKRQFMFKGPAEVLSDTGVWVTWAVRDNAAKEGEGVTEYAARVCAACAHDYARKNRGRGRKRAPKTAQEGKA